MKIRAVIVDDEPPARNKIRKFLEARADTELVGEAGDGVEAIERLLELRPDLVFLDIQMPRGDGFEVLREVYPSIKPAVIFTTAYDQYAVRAFELEALDYLLKPFTADRFHAAVDRAIKSRAAPSDLTDKLTRVLEGIHPVPAQAQRILVRSEGRIYFVKVSDIEWVEAEEKYVLLHTRSQTHLVRQSISALATRLAPASFVRIHRCYLVNLEALQQLAPLAHGDLVAILKSGVRLNVGRSYRDGLLRELGEEGTGNA